MTMTTTVDWSRSGCADLPPHVMMPSNEDDTPSSDPDDYVRPLAACAICPLVVECEARWVEIGRPAHGTWFGTTPTDRKRAKLGSGHRYVVCQNGGCGRQLPEMKDDGTAAFKYCSVACTKAARRAVNREHERRRRSGIATPTRADAGRRGRPAARTSQRIERIRADLDDEEAERVAATIATIVRDLAGYHQHHTDHRCAWCGDHLHPESTRETCNDDCAAARAAYRTRIQRAAIIPIAHPSTPDSGEQIAS